MLQRVFDITGFVYFVAHPFLYPLLRARLLPSLLLSILVFTTLFLWTYLPQVAFLAIFHGRHLAWVNGAFLVLGEGAAITALLFEAFFIDETLVDVFDATLINEGCRDLVSTSRVLNPDATDPTKELGKPITKAIYSPFSLRQIIEFIVFLPLNFIPVAGFTKKERNTYIGNRKLRYTWFGVVALILQLLPVLSMLFLLTTAAGSALWVAKLEEKRRSLSSPDDLESTSQYEDHPP
ncbi:MAG: hypothetical protein LQ346_002354 [Caloplaca aetnensis]|nr:MAG: hypothetical protein LQ346_002354 [Caloplaca aetnensis]